MSYTTMLVIDDDGDVCDDSQYSNAWGFGPMVWCALIAKYKRSIPGLLDHGEFSFDGWPKLWKAEKDNPPLLQQWERIVLHATYDHAMIRGADLAMVADAMDRFHEAHATAGFACSLKAIAARLRDLAAGVRTKFVAPDVCFVGTSVAADQWLKPGDDEDDDMRPYNVKRDEDHWYVEVGAAPAPPPKETAE